MDLISTVAGGAVRWGRRRAMEGGRRWAGGQAGPREESNWIKFQWLYLHSLSLHFTHVIKVNESREPALLGIESEFVI